MRLRALRLRRELSPMEPRKVPLSPGEHLEAPPELSSVFVEL